MADSESAPMTFNTIFSVRAAKGGRAKSAQKTAAARMNGKLGGRPRKKNTMSATKITVGQFVRVDWQHPVSDNHVSFVGVTTGIGDRVAYVVNADNLTANDRGVIRRGGGAAFPAECYPLECLTPTGLVTNKGTRKSEEVDSE